MACDPRDLNIDQIERVHNLVSKLSSSDPEVSMKAISDADQYISSKKTKKQSDRSQINSYTPNSNEAVSGDAMDTATFMKELSQDADERHKRKQLQRSKSEKFKARANEYFKIGDWSKACECYSHAIEICKDWDILYTNRAQALLRLCRFDEAIKDCDLVIRIHPETPIEENSNASKVTNTTVSKAYLCKGKALLSLMRPSEALEAFAHSRWFTLPKRCDHCPPADSSEHSWPSFLKEYVSHAENAEKTLLLDQQLNALSIHENGDSCSAETVFLRLLKSDLISYTVDLSPDAILKHGANLQIMAQLLRNGGNRMVTKKTEASPPDLKSAMPCFMKAFGFFSESFKILKELTAPNQI
ncbi:Tetratricopeptide repeat protein 12 [Cichlidogyrus casuarinus]|uniref:Tetratricopeptide repeat protein 12 n=1 Tax=Cichlidogyrus casuarinus TaxID=1844966 RepID=A0ABD2QH39_9PLAT